jgi:D-erythro-7,8-dihydroneopterin triphosphate epimerase
MAASTFGCPGAMREALMEAYKTPDRAIIRIVNLSLRTIIGFIEWERNVLQDVILNITVEFDPRKAVETDSIADSLNYKDLKKEIVAVVEFSKFALLEKLTAAVLEAVMKHEKVLAATVRIDKSHALRFAESVAVEMNAMR